MTKDVQARLGELSALHRLPAGAAASLATLLDVVATDPHAPTAVRDPGEAVDVHIADSLAGLEVEQLRSAHQIADLGAGAGFPGLVLAAALPRARVTLIESAGRKCEFIRAAATAAGMGNVDVVHARVEEWSPPGEGCDAVTARALAPLGVLVEYAAPLLRVGGALVAWKAAPDAAEDAVGANAAAEVGLRAVETRAVTPFPDARSRTLHLYLKDRSTPNRFPRRPGVARKRPLGGGVQDWDSSGANFERSGGASDRAPD
jgi:16S rRNA (guanine527-N7)-methyltransferase